MVQYWEILLQLIKLINQWGNTILSPTQRLKKSDKIQHLDKIQKLEMNVTLLAG